MEFNIKNLFNQIFTHKLDISNEVTHGLPEGVLWDNNQYYIEKEGNQFVVFTDGHFDLTRHSTLEDAISWARTKTATSEDSNYV